MPLCCLCRCSVLTFGPSGVLPKFLVYIDTICVWYASVLSLSLFGMFDLRVPSFLIDASAKRSGGGGLMGAFFMAVTLALTSFSCSLPFLAALFADFEQGDQLTATILLVIYSVTMAAPLGRLMSSILRPTTLDSSSLPWAMASMASAAPRRRE